MKNLACRYALVAAGVIVASAPGRAQVPSPLPTKPVLTLDIALKVIEAAKADAARNGWPCVIAVVDDGGWLIAMERMDHPAMQISIELAPGKARSAALFRKPTAELEKSINGGRIAGVTASGSVQMQGGLPLRVGDQVVGAIGVSADTPEHDQAISQAAVDAFQSEVGR